jgi:hypothetical protein
MFSAAIRSFASARHFRHFSLISPALFSQRDFHRRCRYGYFDADFRFRYATPDFASYAPPPDYYASRRRRYFDDR